MPGEGEGLAGHRLLQEAPALPEAVARGLHMDAEGVVLALGGAAAHADVQLALGKVDQHRQILGEADRVVPGQHHHRGTEPEARAGGGDVREQDEGIGLRVVVGEVMLHHPGGIEALLLQQPGIGDRLAIEAAVIHPRLTHRADLIGEVQPPIGHRFHPAYLVLQR